MTAELKDQIRALMDAGIRAVPAQEAARGRDARPAAFRARRARAGLRSRRAGVIAAGAAAACAGAVVAVQVAGPSGPASAAPGASTPAVLSAAYVRHLAAASRLALATSGEAVVTTRQILDGRLQATSMSDITFAGGNWNDTFRESLPAQPGTQATTESAVNRVVDGQAYDFLAGPDGMTWYHNVEPDAVSALGIADPRRLLAGLAAAARFERLGTGTLDGVRVTHLRATAVRGLPAITLANLLPDGTPAALDVWTDGHGLVRRMTLSYQEALYPGTMTMAQLRHLPKSIEIVGLGSISKDAQRARVTETRTLKDGREALVIQVSPADGVRVQNQVTTATVDFSAGQPAITAPAHSITIHGEG
jgi:hypothetical protein